MNIKNKFNQAYGNHKMNKQGSGGTWKAIVTGIILLGVAYLLLAATITVTFTAESIDLSATGWAGKEVRYEDIETVEYLDDFELGSRDMGLGGIKTNVGNFSNHTIGAYKLYAYTDVKAVVKIQKKDKEFVVFNAKSVEETKELYEKVLLELGA